ncbi:MAG: hypothetical protein ACK4NC_07300, partial [Candidatus Gracilibacteria bacterium]
MKALAVLLIKTFSNVPVLRHITERRSQLVFAWVLFLVSIIEQLYVLTSCSTFPLMLEILISNYTMIAALLGLNVVSRNIEIKKPASGEA